MGYKVFVSYKYSDSNVFDLRVGEVTTARHYVDVLQNELSRDGHVNKGEKDEESLENFKDLTIASKLRGKIYDSSITIALVSKGMKVRGSERDQWIPWEIAYSLREQTRGDRVSRTNGVLALVLPDENNSYSYYIEDQSCPHCKCRTLRTDTLFAILRENMFNASNKKVLSCANHVGGGVVYTGMHSYIPSVKWQDFVADMNKYLDQCKEHSENIDAFEIVKEF